MRNLVHVLLHALSAQTLVRLPLLFLFLLNWPACCALLSDQHRAVVVGLQLGLLVNCLSKLSHHV
jgi:hypothetical protein